MLQYKGDHTTLGYWYNWIKYKDRFDIEHREILHCGDSIPLLWQNRPQGAIMGQYYRTPIDLPYPLVYRTLIDLPYPHRSTVPS